MRKITAIIVAAVLLLTAGAVSTTTVAHDDASDDRDGSEDAMSDGCPTADGGMMGMMHASVHDDCPICENGVADGMRATETADQMSKMGCQ